MSGNPANTTVGQLGDLDYLLTWTSDDAPDDYEMNRNNVIYKWQNNRNPFIDLPELAEYVYGSKTSEVWNSSLGIDDVVSNNIKHFNPVVEYLKFNIDIVGEITIYTIQGKTMLIEKINGNKVDLSTFSQGVYFFNIRTETSNYQGKMIKI